LKQQLKKKQPSWKSLGTNKKGSVMGLVLIGCGKMGGAMLAGWLEQGVEKETIRIIEKDAAYGESLNAKFGVRVLDDIEKLEEDFDAELVVLAVKPQVMDDVVLGCKHLATKSNFISIAAGKTVSYFEGILGEEAKIIRVMPNTPAAVGRGMSVAFANQNVSSKIKETCTNLLAAIGQVSWLSDEALMDAVTAVSGSGPAYVFYMTECLAQAGVKAGLPEDQAMTLARATVCGAGELMFQSEESASQLRINVTSPGGTTQAALEVLMGPDGILKPMEEAIKAAEVRSKELAG
jgi:pyrroline-5-carboxylate reductase